MDAAQAAASMDAAQAAARHVEAVVRRSGTSFYWAMRLLPEARRQAMYAIYAFCREVDDIADEPGEVAAKLAGLEGWRGEIAALYAGRPRLPTAVALHAAVRRFDLPRAELLAVIDGMAMDLSQTRYLDFKGLQLYCYRVASCVGLMCIHIFGEPAAHEWAEYNLPADFQSPALALPESERYPESAAVSSPISDDY
mgnify:CR=1 FL=1